MKRLFSLLILGLSLLASERLSAQSWLDALKGVATEVIDEATGGKLTEMAIAGEWKYIAPGVRMGSSDMLSNLAGSAMESTIEAKLATAYEKVGIRPDFCQITFTKEDTWSMPVKGHEVTGTYSYDPATHAITLTLAKLGASFTGYAYIDGTNLELVFPVNKLVEFVTALGSKISSLSSVSKMLEKYDDVYLGFQFAK